MSSQIYKSPLGEIFLSTNETSVTGLWFCDQAYYQRTFDAKEIQNPILLAEVKAYLDAYFRFEKPMRPSFSYALKGTPFQNEVYAILQEIPYGDIWTYSDVKKRLSEKGILTSARAIGQAIAKNPISILIPCHRVIAKSGALTGYAGGIKRKAYLLENEHKALCEWYNNQ